MKLLNTRQLAALAAHCAHKHITGEQLEVVAWVEAGKPAVWAIVEEAGDWAVAIDSGYGLLALFRGTKCFGVGKYSIHADPPEVIALDKGYYGLTRYLWMPANDVTGLREARHL
jgi:hypothetical protein